MNPQEIIKQHFSNLGKKGGKAKANKMTPEQRKEAMKKVWEASKIAREKRKLSTT